MNEIKEKLEWIIDCYKDDLRDVIQEFKIDYITYEQAIDKIKKIEKVYEEKFENFPEEECEFDYAYEFASDFRSHLNMENNKKSRGF